MSFGRASCRLSSSGRTHLDRFADTIASCLDRSTVPRTVPHAFWLFCRCGNLCAQSGIPVSVMWKPVQVPERRELAVLRHSHSNQTTARVSERNCLCFRRRLQTQVRRAYLSEAIVCSRYHLPDSFNTSKSSTRLSFCSIRARTIRIACRVELSRWRAPTIAYPTPYPCAAFPARITH